MYDADFSRLFGNYLGTSGNSAKVRAFRNYLKELLNENKIFSSSLDVQDEFLTFYPTWIESSKLNTVIGLDTFPYKFVSLGTTQTLDWFIFNALSEKRTIRFFRGEYPYNRDIFNFDFNNNFIDDRPLEKGDTVIISAPFSGTGNMHEEYDNLMITCNELDIPVMVDCAWFGTCYDMDIKLNYDCIKVVAFSTTKGLNAGDYRAGIAFSKWNYGPLAIQTQWHHGIHLNLYLSLALMKEFSPDTVPNLYKDIQYDVCNWYNLQPSKTVHITTTLDDSPDWDYFLRDGVYVRVNIKDILLDNYEKRDWQR